MGCVEEWVAGVAGVAGVERGERHAHNPSRAKFVGLRNGEREYAVWSPRTMTAAAAATFSPPSRVVPGIEKGAWRALLSDV